MAVTPNEDAVKAGYEISCKRTSMTGRPITRLEDLARRAGVSTATVSRALNDSAAVNVATKREIWKLAREHNYPFRRYMPSGPIGAQATIAVVITRPQGRVDRLSDPFLLELVGGIGDAARERGCDRTGEATSGLPLLIRTSYGRFWFEKKN